MPHLAIVLSCKPGLASHLLRRLASGRSVRLHCVYELQAMRRDIAKQLQETRPQRSATAPGKTWLRGWDDWKKEQAPATA